MSLSLARISLVLIGTFSCLVGSAQAQGNALYLDGTGGVTVPGSASLNLTGPYTFEAWVRRGIGVQNGPLIFRKDGYNTLPYQFAGDSTFVGVGSNWIHNAAAGGWCSFGWNNPYVDGWAHIASTFDGATMRLYINGEQVQQCGMPVPWSNLGAPLHIGWYNSAYDGVKRMTAWLDEVRIWNVARTGAQIVQLADASITPQTAASYAGLVACWGFENDATDSTGINHGSTFGGASFQPTTGRPVLDCNSNGVADWLELQSGASRDINANSIPDECEAIATYCTAGTTTNGCTPSMAWSGTPSASAASGFQIICAQSEGDRYGLILYGMAPAAVSWAINSTSLVCVAPPQRRTGAYSSGGTIGTCTGTYSLDFNAFIQAEPGALGSPFSAGQAFYAQAWFRDHGAPKGTNLSNGLRFTLAP